MRSARSLRLCSSARVLRALMVHLRSPSAASLPLTAHCSHLTYGEGERVQVGACA